MTVTLRSGEKITASKAVLNHLSIVLVDAAELYKRIEHHASAELARQDSNDIYKALKETGYYDNAK